jgi:hypothetical protein
MIRPRLLTASLTGAVLLGGFVSLGALSARGRSQNHPGYVPKNGFVPDEKTAIAVAEAVLIPVYGQKQIESEEPFSTRLDGDTWSVHGSLPNGPNVTGGVAEVQISKSRGCVLHMIHGK